MSQGWLCSSSSSGCLNKCHDHRCQEWSQAPLFPPYPKETKNGQGSSFPSQFPLVTTRPSASYRLWEGGHCGSWKEWLRPRSVACCDWYFRTEKRNLHRSLHCFWKDTCFFHQFCCVGRQNVANSEIITSPFLRKQTRPWPNSVSFHLFYSVWLKHYQRKLDGFPFIFQLTWNMSLSTQGDDSGWAWCVSCLLCA